MRLNIPKEPRAQWNSPVPDYNILTEGTCKLLFEQAQAYFYETIKESEALVQRSTTMLFLLLPAIATVIGYCISNQDKFKLLDNFDAMLILGAAGCISNCVFNLFRLISRQNIHYRGAQPEEMMRPDIFQLRDINQVERALFISEIERVQIKIEHMEFWNHERIFLYTDVVYSFYAMIGIGVVLLLRSI
ncbi:MAG: hypothetical protein ABIR18_03090 [Chitinophagaceae bacterium]